MRITQAIIFKISLSMEKNIIRVFVCRVYSVCIIIYVSSYLKSLYESGKVTVG